ncbi:MAG: FAD-binding oxidoreductase [Candidatus Wallbacteria bacterium]|nr:FAD-binding oxidoreductase [Candidatus Wallbacteria bacterium]
MRPAPVCRARVRPPRGATTAPRRLTDAADLEPYLHDEAHFPGGHTPGVFLPADEGQVARALSEATAVLPVGARSSLTGGATPFGAWVLSLEQLARLEPPAKSSVLAGAGVSLTLLQSHLAGFGFWYPPVPTFTGALVGGVVSTNAAGAATFKYGTTRDWVAGLTVMLASGGVLELERGAVCAHPEGYFELEDLGRPMVRVPVPRYRMPDVPKRSAGYHTEPGMDLIDLFVGSEGTLAIVLEARLRILPRPAATLTALVVLESDALAFELTAALREASLATRRLGDPQGIDVCAIEALDARCLEILREDGADRACGVELRPGDGAALLLQAELPAALDEAQACDQIGRFEDSDAPDTPLVRLCRLLASRGALDRMSVALPGDTARAAQLFALREAVPVGVNRRIGQAQRERHPAIQKVAADMIVPFDRFPEMMRLYRDAFGRRGLDHAIWGHISDGNVHPNVLPRSIEEVAAGKEAILELGRELARLGGCPLSEHGTGRNPVKQALLAQLYGAEGIDAMRQVKRALDPGGKLAPGVLFSVARP